jgi:hypothetical protein
LNYFKVRSSGEALIIDQAEDVMLDFFRSNPGFEYTSKGGLGHYLHVFPGDTYLELLHCLVRRTVGEQS